MPMAGCVNAMTAREACDFTVTHAQALLFPSPRERSEWRGAPLAKATAGGGACPAEARRAKADGGAACSAQAFVGAYCKLGASLVPPPLAPQQAQGYRICWVFARRLRSLSPLLRGEGWGEGGWVGEKYGGGNYSRRPPLPPSLSPHAERGSASA